MQTDTEIREAAALRVEAASCRFTHHSKKRRDAASTLKTAALFAAVSIFSIQTGCSRPPAPAIAATAAAQHEQQQQPSPAASSAPSDPAAFSGPIAAGRLADARVDEASGLAPSRRADGVLWTHNDSGGEPVLYALSTTGALLGTVWLEGMDNVDWEDIASFTLNGRAYLLVADTGDNNSRRKNCGLYVIEEPDPAQLSPQKEITAPIAWTIPIAYPDAPHDCEAVAVDPGARADGGDGKVYLLLKREQPNRIFTVPLKPATPGARQIAWQAGQISQLPQPTSAQRLLPLPTGRYRGQPTAMDFSPDGRMALVLTYGDVLLFPRGEGETWATALMRAPVVLPPHKLGQAEGACFSRDSKAVYVTEEAKNAALVRYEVQ